MGRAWQAQTAPGTQQRWMDGWRWMEASPKGSISLPVHPSSPTPGWSSAPQEARCWLPQSGSARSQEPLCSNYFTCACFTHTTDASPLERALTAEEGVEMAKVAADQRYSQMDDLLRTSGIYSHLRHEMPNLLHDYICPKGQIYHIG